MKNRTLIEAARTMLADSFLPIPFWAEAVNTVCYVQNRVLVTKPYNKTLYELLHGRTPSIGFMRPFGCLVTILNTLDSLGKFKGKVDEGFLVGYFVNSKAFRVFNSRTRIVQETLHNKEGDTAFDEKKHDAEKPKSALNLSPNSSALSGEQDDMTKKKDKQKSPVDYFTGHRDLNGDYEDYSEDSSNDIEAMQEELLQFKMQKVWILVDLPHGKRAIGHTQEEGIDYEEVFPPVARIKAIRLFLAYASFIGFMVYQMDVKSAFLYGTIKEEVYVCQPSGFEDPDHPDKVYKVVKALYGLHQAPRAWYETLANYHLENGFHRGKIDQTLFIKKQKRDTLLVQIYVKQKKDEIFISQDKYVAKILRKFGLTEGKSASTPIHTEKPLLKDPDSEDVDVHIYRSMIGLLMYLTSSRPDIMFAVYACYPKDSSFDLVAYSDSDYAGASLDIKSTTEGCQFLGCRMISWQCKKQIVVATSTTEAEYVAGASCCTQVLWIQNQMLDYGYIEYASTVNPTIYVSCIKQFWKTVAVKSSNDVTRLQALVDKKKVVVTEAAIMDALHLDDAEGFDCLPNEEIFTELARMGYEKPSIKLTFYKAFFSSQFIHLITQNKLGDLSTHSTKYISPALTQKVFANMKRVGKGCSRVETPLFEGMLVARETEEHGDAKEQGTNDNAVEEPDTAEALDVCAAQARRVEHLEHDKVAQDLEIIKLKTRVKKLERANKGRIIDKLDKDEGAVLMNEKEEIKEVRDNTSDAQVAGRQAHIYQIDMDHVAKVLSMQEDESEVHEAVEVVTTAKLITKVVATVSEIVCAAAVVPAAVSETVSVAAVVPTVTATPVKVAVPSTKRRIRVVIWDPGEKSSAKTPTETKSKDKGKGIMVEEPKPMKKKQQVELDEAYARKIHKELNHDIDWEVAIDHVKQKAKEDPFIQRYQVMKKRPQTEAQARRNMMMYLKNTAGFRLDYFKGMSYDDIHPIFEAKFNANMEFLLKSKEQIGEETNRAIESINQTLAQKAAKRRRLNKEAKDVEELRQHLEIVPDEDDDVYTEATPLARKVPVMDYQINQRSVHGQGMVKSWKLLQSCGVHIITFTTTQIILLVERRYPLPRFTLDQMLNTMRVQVEEQSEMSLEIIRFTRQQLQEGQHN
nr:retrovirus-related Pol polyprotein from transposon TNT 1-94 [Tanacetum cinerariifolium]